MLGRKVSYQANDEDGDTITVFGVVRFVADRAETAAVPGRCPAWMGLVEVATNNASCLRAVDLTGVTLLDENDYVPRQESAELSEARSRISLLDDEAASLTAKLRKQEKENAEMRAALTDALASSTTAAVMEQTARVADLQAQLAAATKRIADMETSSRSGQVDDRTAALQKHIADARKRDRNQK